MSNEVITLSFTEDEAVLLLSAGALVPQLINVGFIPDPGDELFQSLEDALVKLDNAIVAVQDARENAIEVSEV